MAEKLSEKIGRAAFNRTRRGRQTQASRPQRDTRRRNATDRFNDFVVQEMRSGKPRAAAIEAALNRTNNRLRGRNNSGS